ncbi:MAG: hypothetical protein U0797_17265 [Gemmataceae bacterium]
MRGAVLILAVVTVSPAAADDEEQKRDAVVDRFILADTGRLAGAEAKRATEEFKRLGVEAVPALLRGLHRSAKLEHSCPVLMIAKRLLTVLQGSDDERLVELARDEIAAVPRTRHADALADLRVRLAMHQSALARRPPIPPKGPGVMTTQALMKAVPKVRGEPLYGVLRELGKRDEKEALTGLSLAANSRDPEAGRLAREMLDAVLGRESLSALKERLEDGGVEVKRAAIRVARDKHVELTLAVIDRLTDDSPAVRAEARAALRKLSDGKEDFGPEPAATKPQQTEARKRWKAWWLGRAK